MLTYYSDAWALALDLKIDDAFLNSNQLNLFACPEERAKSFALTSSVTTDVLTATAAETEFCSC
jgi:hypothetical protein